MADIKNSITELVGKTPMVRLNNIIKNNHLKADVLVKLESANPAGSAKDRIAKEMIFDALDRGIINRETTLIEPTSGNTGIGLAAIGAALGMPVIITMPDTQTIERVNLIKAYGAKVISTPGAEGIDGAMNKAEEIHHQIENSYITGQFENHANPRAHYKTTGPEIYEQTDGKVDFFIAGVGTGGTISGVGHYLKEKNPEVKIIAVEPAYSPYLSKGIAGKSMIQGIVCTSIPDVLDTNIYDEIISITDEDAFECGREIARSEGILVGVSAGAALQAAKIIASREENEGKTIVALLCDSGDRYYSTPLIQDEQ